MAEMRVNQPRLPLGALNRLLKNVCEWIWMPALKMAHNKLWFAAVMAKCVCVFPRIPHVHRPISPLRPCSGRLGHIWGKPAKDKHGGKMAWPNGNGVEEGGKKPAGAISSRERLKWGGPNSPAAIISKMLKGREEENRTAAKTTPLNEEGREGVWPIVCQLHCS